MAAAISSGPRRNLSRSSASSLIVVLYCYLGKFETN
jgi:hypothetical protein